MSSPKQTAGNGGRESQNRTAEEAVALAITEAKSVYAARNPASKALFDSAQVVMPGGNTRSALHFDPFPLYVARSEGASIIDVDGHRYLDVLGEFTAGLYGHNDEVIRSAVLRAVDAGASNGAPGEAEIRMAELICDRFPAIEKVRFCNSGTEANLYALTLARISTGRNKFLCFSGAYHGGVFVFGGGGSPMNIPFDWTVCRYNDETEASAAIDALGADLAAVIVEPMMSNGGCIAATNTFLQVLRERTEANGALLIFDEVVTSRMGRGGMQKIHNIAPDLTTLGKYLGAGFSFGAFGGRSDLLDLMNPSRTGSLPHAGTFNNNVFTMAAGVAALQQNFTPERADDLFKRGEALRSRLNKLAADRIPGVQFTGCGSVMNLHFCAGAIKAPEDLSAEPKQLLQLFHLDMMELGIYPARRGQINLSLPMRENDFDRVSVAFEHFLSSREELITGLLRPNRS